MTRGIGPIGEPAKGSVRRLIPLTVAPNFMEGVRHTQRTDQRCREQQAYLPRDRDTFVEIRYRQIDCRVFTERLVTGQGCSQYIRRIRGTALASPICQHGQAVSCPSVQRGAHLAVQMEDRAILVPNTSFKIGQ